MVMVCSLSLMETPTKASMSRVKRRGTEFRHLQMETVMMVLGYKGSRMELLGGRTREESPVSKNGSRVYLGYGLERSQEKLQCGPCLQKIPLKER